MARPVSEVASWDGRLDQQRQNAKWRRPSSSLVRDPHHAPLENQPLENLDSSAKFSDMRRAEQSFASRSNPKRHSWATSSAAARLASRLDTTSTPSHESHHYRQASSISHAAPNTVSRSSSLIPWLKSSHLTPNSSVHAPRVLHPRLTSSHEPIAPSQSTSTTETDVIDLTLEDTEDELCVRDMLVPYRTKLRDKYTRRAPRPRSSSSGHSSPIALEQSLFTPPPSSKRRTRLVIDFIAVPSLPKGLTRADYRPILDHSVVPLPGPTVANTLGDPPPAEHTVNPEDTPRKRKGKERELDVTPRKKHKQRSTQMIPGELLDAIYEHTMIPLYDDDAYPPLTCLDLATNTRFQFAHAWREHASKLREAELEWTFNLKVLNKACIWARTVNTSSPRMPGTAGYVSSEQLQPWQLVPPEDSPQGKSTKHIVDEQTHVMDGHAILEVETDDLLLPEDPLPSPSAAIDPSLSNSTVSEGLTAVDVEHDMHQYFNGLGDSPAKHIPPCQQLHAFRPQLFPSAGHTQMNSLGLGFPSLELDPRLADTGDRECFLGVPPSPPPVDMESSTIPGPISNPSFEPGCSPASPSNIFDTSPTDAWSFEQGETLLLGSETPPSNHITPTALGTIDPSLLGPEQGEQGQQPPRAPESTTPKRRSKLPEPIIYMRRPMDSSSVPLLSGKRSVQIKYRDSGESQASSNLADPIEQPRNDADDSSRARRRSAPSSKLRESHSISESDSDYIPETSTSKIKIKIKRPSLRSEETAVEPQASVPSMSSCHQCRNTTGRPKMSCSNVIQGRVCGKRFCNRCILYRYPDVTFDQDSAGFLCPVCTNTCNCSVCSRNRGEEFVSMRLGGLAASLFKTRVTLVRDVDKPPHSAHSPPSVDVQRSASATTTPTPEPGVLPTQPHFWAHVYGMEGERVGTAFMTREHMERLQTRAPSPPPPLSKPSKKARQSTKRDRERDKTSGPRVFIGQPLSSWKIRAVRDLEPSMDVETTLSKEKQGTRRRRWYIGHLAPLHEPYERMPGCTPSPSPSSPSSRSSTPVLDSDGSLTALSELEADDYNWPQPDVGECCSWVPPGMVVDGVDGSGVAVPFAMGLPDVAGTWHGVDAPQPGLGSGSGDMNGGEAPARASIGMSVEEMKTAIHRAFEALGATPPC